jgi:subtilisin family serine protease
VSSLLALDAPELIGLTGHGVRIAILDSGVHTEHPHIGRIEGGIGFDAEGRLHPDFVDRLGHGTAVTAAVQEKAPRATVLAIKVFDRTLATSAMVLARAIEWAAGQNARLVNLSLGTTNPARAPLLADAVAFAAERGTLVVAAARHDGAPCYPGALPGVMDVELDWSCPRNALRIVDGQLLASGEPRPIPGVPPERNLRGISFAVANATAFLTLALEKYPHVGTAEELRSALSSASSVG